MTTTFPVLPPELQEEIFQIAAWQSTETANTLIRVSKEVAYRIEPILYEIVTVDGLKFTAQKFLPPLTKLDPSEVLDLFQRYGRHIHCLSIEAKQDTAIAYLKLCPSLKNLLIPTLSSIDTINTIQEYLPNLQRLSGAFAINQASLDASKPGFSRLTHLDMVGTYSWNPIMSKFLPRLSCLTHLAIDDVGEDDRLVLGALKYCKKLRALVLVAEYSDREGVVGIRAGQSGPVDRRIVHVSISPLDSWLAGVTGGRDMWKLADEVILQRRGGGG